MFHKYCKMNGFDAFDHFLKEVAQIDFDPEELFLENGDLGGSESSEASSDEDE